MRREGFMSRNLLVVSTVLSLALAGAAWAATPEQVGTYTGTIKSKVFSPSGKTSTKLPMELSIAEDNSTTVTIDGALQDDEEMLLDPVDGVLFFEGGTTSSFSMITLHFKNTKIKGSGSGFIEGPPLTVTESKISLKKVAP
jgi:hypothetical protein